MLIASISRGQRRPPGRGMHTAKQHWDLRPSLTLANTAMWPMFLAVTAALRVPPPHLLWPITTKNKLTEGTFPSSNEGSLCGTYLHDFSFYLEGECWTKRSVETNDVAQYQLAMSQLMFENKQERVCDPQWRRWRQTKMGKSVGIFDCNAVWCEFMFGLEPRLFVAGTNLTFGAKINQQKHVGIHIKKYTQVRHHTWKGCNKWINLHIWWQV